MGSKVIAPTSLLLDAPSSSSAGSGPLVALVFLDLVLTGEPCVLVSCFFSVCERVREFEGPCGEVDPKNPSMVCWVTPRGVRRVRFPRGITPRMRERLGYLLQAGGQSQSQDSG